MPKMPRDPSPESTLAFLRDPYRFISARCQRYHADLFETRLLLRKTICMMGKEAAELFDDPERFTRIGAAPEPVQSTLFGHGGVQGLDGQTHVHRKQMFMGLMTPARIDLLVDMSAD